MCLQLIHCFQRYLSPLKPPIVWSLVSRVWHMQLQISVLYMYNYIFDRGRRILLIYCVQFQSGYMS